MGHARVDHHLAREMPKEGWGVLDAHWYFAQTHETASYTGLNKPGLECLFTVTNAWASFGFRQLVFVWFYHQSTRSSDPRECLSPTTQKNHLTRCYALNGGKALLLLTYNLGLLSPINKDLFVSTKERGSNFRYNHLSVRATVRLRASSQVHGKRARARRRRMGQDLTVSRPVLLLNRSFLGPFQCWVVRSRVSAIKPLTTLF